jgi:hypothetical protein
MPPSTMTFSRTHANQQVRCLTRPELDLAIHVICSAFNSHHFPGVETLDDVRQLVDILAHEKHRRDVMDTIREAGN